MSRRDFLMPDSQTGAGASPIFAARRVTASEAVEAGNAAVEDALKPDAIDLRNQDHANLMNVILEALRKRGRDHFEPEDISHIWTMIDLLDKLAGNHPRAMHAAFKTTAVTSAKAKAVERATTDPAFEATVSGTNLGGTG